MRLINETLTEELILAVVRENARVASVVAGPTAPDPRAVIIYHHVRSIIMGLAMGDVGKFAEMVGATADEVAAVERHRDEIMAADPQLARKVAAIEARRRAPVAPPVKRPKRARRASEADAPVTESAEESASASDASPLIGYSTPKGKPHVLRTKTVTQAWERLERFLNACTDADPVQPVSATLLFSETKEVLERPGMVDALDGARAVLGPSRASAWAGLGAMMPELAAISGGALVTGGVQHQWTVRGDQFQVALDLMRAGDPWPRELMPIASLAMMHQFSWTGTGKSETDAGHSRCMTFLSARSTINPMFVFPYANADEEFLSFLARITPLLPIPLAAKNFRLLQPTKSAGWVQRLFDTSEIARVLDAR